KGVRVEVDVLVRERRFVQLIGNKTVYFKEFGSTRDLNKATGNWAEKGTRLPASDRATEVLYFGNKSYPGSPYHIPRWISNTPSVIGSRQAEELNLEFFASGGIPPVMITIAGGQLTPESKEALEKIVTG